ncbi:hypothetical protein BST81_04145 [Leptolyngbya sp. 'hensonii']|nr:hypothetical protein BST81_04145 [Leptolyngbya sp. 'hensonii']
MPRYGQPPLQLGALPGVVTQMQQARIIHLATHAIFWGFAECKYELPSSPTLLPQEKGAKTLVPSPLGEG